MYIYIYIYTYTYINNNNNKNNNNNNHDDNKLLNKTILNDPLSLGSPFPSLEDLRQPRRLRRRRRRDRLIAINVTFDKQTYIISLNYSYNQNKKDGTPETK